MTSTVETAGDIRPFNVDIPDAALEHVRRRVAATNWPETETELRQQVRRFLEPPEAYSREPRVKEPIPNDRPAMARRVAVCRGAPRRVELTARPKAGRPCGRPARSEVAAGCRW
jgi:hypothetical protein